jgi:hypothetical protein
MSRTNIALLMPRAVPVATLGACGAFRAHPSFLVVPHRRTADPRCVKLCYSVCALSAQRSVFSLVREARLVVGPGDLEHP